LLPVIASNIGVTSADHVGLGGGWMTSNKPRVALHTMTAALALLVVSCNRQPSEPKHDAAPAPPPAAATTGTIAQSDSPAAGAAPAAASAASNADTWRDPEAIKALERMGDYLRTLKAFQVRSETNRDEVLDDGQSVEFDGVVDMIVERPNRLRADVTSDKQQRLYFYNGTTLSVWGRRVNYYATVPAPPTIRELVDTLNSKYDIELPLADLFYWSDRTNASNITSATDLGPSQIGGVTSEHYAFRQEGVDWQVWIQQGDYPLPRKVVIRTLTDEAKPRFAAVLTWNLAPSFNAAAFTFVPPPDAKRITLAEVRAAGSERASGH
jgi:hypothetical protein